MSTFSKNTLTTEQAFWAMYHFPYHNYELSKGQWELTDILSMTQPFEFNEQGHFDGKVTGNRNVAPADSAMITFWNEAVKKVLEDGRPSAGLLKK